MSYFTTRFQQLGIDTSKYFCIQESIDESTMPARKLKLFKEDKNGNIILRYQSLTGEAIEYNGEDLRQIFHRVRYSPENEALKGHKYTQPPQSGIEIYLPPQFLELYKKEPKIETLIVVEGEFKTLKGAAEGLPIVGIAGKDLFIEYGKGPMHPTLMKIIKEKGVQNLVLLLDVDAKRIEKWDFEAEPYKDLSQRLYSFYSTVKTFRHVSKHLITYCYAAIIKENWLPDSKGLDDLLCNHPEKSKEICDKLLKIQKGKQPYFEYYDLFDLSLTAIKGEFYLNTFKGVPQKFYENFSLMLGEHKFVFNSSVYQHGPDDLVVVNHKDSQKFIRVACNYLKIINTTTSKGLPLPKLEPWKAGEINRDYVNKGAKNFFDTIEKFDTFCNVPENEPLKYEQKPFGNYNLYFKLEHIIEPGTWQNIAFYLKHVFGEAPLISGNTNTKPLTSQLKRLYLPDANIKIESAPYYE